MLTDATEKKGYGFALLSLLVMYVWAITRTVVSIGLNQPMIMAKYSNVIYGAISLLCIAIFIVQILLKRYISISEAFAVVFIAYILMNIYITASIHGSMSKTAYDSLLEFGVKGIPAILLGCVAARKTVLHKVINCLDAVIAFMAFAMARALYIAITQGIVRVRLGTTFGVDYQQISYYSSYFFAINLFMILIGRKMIPGRIRTSAVYQIIRVLECLIFALVSLYSGGRGGFIVILVSLAFWIFYYSIQTKHYKFLFLGILVIFLLLYIVFHGVLDNTVFSTGFLRIFEFVGQDEINWDGTSGRYGIYSRVFELIGQGPIIGHGITGGSYYNIASSHNWILEILVEGGIVYLAVWGFILFKFFAKLKEKLKRDEAYWFLAIVFLTDFVGLMVSYIYLRCTAFWFVIFYVLNERNEVENLQWKGET